MKPFHFWAQKVLPLVYDDSLSYYEVLAKVTYKLNECINSINNITSEGVIDYIESGQADAALEERIDALADDLSSQVADNTDALKDTLLKYDHFYKVTDIDGIRNDGTTDCYYGLRTLMDQIWSSNEKAIVYFPSGIYKNAVGVIPIPDNVIIFGDGPSSILYRSDVASVTTDTGFLCPCGDNIVIYNIKVQLNVEAAPLQTGPLAVGIGITNIAYPGLYPEFNVVRVPLRRNIICDSVYSDGIYPLQAEVAAGTGELREIVFRNGTYPNGIVSMYPWHGLSGDTSPGNTGSLIQNIKCKWLRIGGRVSAADNFCMYGAGVMVDNCRAEMAWLMADGIIASNIFIDGRNDLSLDGEYINYAVMLCGRVTITNMQILGGGASRTYGILNRSINTVMLSGVSIKNFASAYIAQTFASNQTPGNAMLTNCDFGVPNCGVVGYGVNTLANVPSTLKYFDYSKARYVTLSPESGITFDAPTRTRINTLGPLAWLLISCSSENAWLPANKITQIPTAFAPSGENVFALMSGTDQNGNAINKPINISTDGYVQPWASDASITSWSGVIIAIYSLA